MDCNKLLLVFLVLSAISTPTACGPVWVNIVVIPDLRKSPGNSNIFGTLILAESLSVSLAKEHLKKPLDSGCFRQGPLSGCSEKGLGAHCYADRIVRWRRIYDRPKVCVSNSNVVEAGRSGCAAADSVTKLT